MAGLVTQPTNIKPEACFENLSKQKQADARWLVEQMSTITGCPPVVWGDHFIIGFGEYTYQRKGSSEDLRWFHVGFAPRKTRITIYLAFDMTQESATMERLGKYKAGKGCLYINKLADVDLEVLKELIQKSSQSKWH